MNRLALWALPVIAILSGVFLSKELGGNRRRKTNTVATLISSRGVVKRLNRDELVWDHAVNGIEFEEGDTISVGETGEAVLRFAGGGQTTLTEKSMMTFKLRAAKVELSLSAGTASLNHEQIEIDVRARVGSRVAQSMPPGAPTLSIPAAGAIVHRKISDEATFSWRAAEGSPSGSPSGSQAGSQAKGFEVTLTAPSATKNPAFVRVFQVDKPALSIVLPDGKYLWSVSAYDELGRRGPASSTREVEFKTVANAPMKPPVVAAPPAPKPPRAPTAKPNKQDAAPTEKRNPAQARDDKPPARRSSPTSKPILFTPKTVGD
jgi:hypothetical protein